MNVYETDHFLGPSIAWRSCSSSFRSCSLSGDLCTSHGALYRVGSFSWKFKKNNLCEGVQAIMTCNKKWFDGKRNEKVRSDKWWNKQSHPGCYRSYRALSSFANRTAERPRRYQQHEAQRQIIGIMWSLLKTKNWYKLRYYPAILRPTLPRWAEGPFHAVYNGSSEIHKRKSHGIWNI